MIYLLKNIIILKIFVFMGEFVKTTLRFGRELRWFHHHDDLLESFPVHIRNLSESFLSAGWSYTHEASKYNVIEVPIDNVLTVECVDGVTQVPPGYAMFLPAHEYNKLSYQGSGVLHKFAFSFHGALAHSMCISLLGSRRLLKLGSADFAIQYFKEVRKILRDSDPEGFPQLVGKSTEFLTALSCRQKLEPVNSKVTLASEFIYTRFHSKIRTSQLAESLNVSPWHLKQLFVKEYNVTPGRYVKERQFELAKQLLASDMQIQNIAVQLGYSSGFAFSHAFKKRTGLSPREWRKQKKSSVNV